MTNQSLRKSVASVAVALAATAAMGGTAYADSSPTTPAASSASALAALKAKAATAITDRLNSLNAGMAAINANKWLTSGDKATALAIYGNDVKGLTALGQTIQGDQTLSQATADYRTIFTNYRVYALALPQVRLAAAADDLATGVVPRLSDAQTKLEALLNGPDAGKNTTAVQAAMTDLGKQISAIGQATEGLSATLLAYTPAQWDANPSLLNPPRTTLVTAHADAQTARQDIATVVGTLK